MADERYSYDPSVALIRGLPLIALSMVVAAIVGAVVGLAWPKSYEASAVITLPSDGESQTVETERLVASSTAVLGQAVEELGGTSISDLQASVSIVIPKGTSALEVSAKSGDPERAAAIANAVVKAYNQGKSDGAKLAAVASTATTETRIANLEDLLDGAEEGSRKKEAIQTQLSDAEDRLLDLELQRDVDAATLGKIVSPATEPRQPSTPGLVIFALAGGALGVLMGSGAVLWLARRELMSVSLAKIQQEEA